MKKKRSDDEKSYFDIDKMDLDNEFVLQPKLAKDAADKLADAKLELAEAIAEFEVVKAEIRQKVRLKPQRFKIDKVTEGAIADALVLSEEYKEGLAAVNEAKHKVDVLSGTMTAVEHRKRALTKLCDLFLADYFSSPKQPSAVREKVAESKKNVARRSYDRDEDDAEEDDD